MQQRKHVAEDMEQDPILEKINRGLEFAKTRTVPLAFGALVVIVGILGAVWYVTYRRNQEVDAFVQVHTAVSDYQKAVASTGEDRASELDKVLQNLSHVSGKGHLARARFYQARTAYEKGDYAEAARLFRETATPANKLFGLYSQAGLGAALESQKDWAGALQAYSDGAFAPFLGIEGYEHALTDAAFGRARAAREAGKPEETRTAYQSLAQRYTAARDQAIEKRRAELIQRAKAFLNQSNTQTTVNDLDGIALSLDTWIQTTLQKPQAEQTRIEDGIRLQTEIETFVQALADARKAEAEGKPDSAIRSYATATGDQVVSPSTDQYQRVLLELERLDQMWAHREASTPASK